MKRICFTIFVLILGLLFSVVTTTRYSFAATISGIVIDESGQPVTDVIISIESFKGKFLPTNRSIKRLEPVFPPPEPSPTNAKGAFAIENITKGSVNWIKFLPQHGHRYDVLFIDFQGISFQFLPYMFNSNMGFPFSIEEDNDIKNVRISVRRKMRISGQVLTSDGNPLSNASITLQVIQRNVKGTGKGRSSLGRRLDAEGKFTYYVNNEAYYTLTIQYQNQTVKSKEILLKKGQSIDDLTLKFKEEFIIPKVPVVEKRVPDVNKEIVQLARQKKIEGMWAINPSNRHAYKRINCQTPQEALDIAKEHDAHLLTINDKEEQQWIFDVFGAKNYWIGCIEIDKDGDKLWDNGEPMTFTNWDANPLIAKSEAPESKNNSTEKLFTVLIGVTGKWQQVRDGNAIISITKSAILEKEDLLIGLMKSEE